MQMYVVTWLILLVFLVPLFRICISILCEGNNNSSCCFVIVVGKFLVCQKLPTFVYLVAKFLLLELGLRFAYVFA